MSKSNRKARLSKRERELSLLQRIERCATHLRQYHARPTQTWDWLVPVIARVKAERVILEQALAGDPDAMMLRQTKGRDDANDAMGE